MLRVRVALPTAAVAAFSTLTLAGVAVLGFSSGSLENEVPQGSEWAVATPSGVRVLSPGAGAAGSTPLGTSTGSDDAAADPDAALGSNVDPAAQRLASSDRPLRKASRPSVTSSWAARTAAPVAPRPSVTHRTGTTQSNTLQITLPAEVLTTAREAVAAGLRRGLTRELDTQTANRLEDQLSASSEVDDAVAQATGEAAQQGIMAAQAKAGPQAPPSVVSAAATTTFREVLPKQLTMAVQPVVLVALGSMRSEVSAGALISALGTAADDAAQMVSAEVAEQVGEQVVDLVRTTDGIGVPAPTAAVSTPTETATPATTSATTSPTTDTPASTDPTDRNSEPNPSTTTEPTSQPSSQPTDPATDRSVEPSQTATDSATSTATDPSTDRSTQPTSSTVTEGATDTATDGAGATATGDPTSPTSVTTSATSLTVTVTTSATGAADRQIWVSRTSAATR